MAGLRGLFARGQARLPRDLLLGLLVGLLGCDPDGCPFGTRADSLLCPEESLPLGDGIECLSSGRLPRLPASPCVQSPGRPTGGEHGVPVGVPGLGGPLLTKDKARLPLRGPSFRWG